MLQNTALSSFTSPACGGGRRAKRVGRGRFETITQAYSPSPTLPRKRGREKEASAP
jgi:hypothetical protein